VHSDAFKTLWDELLMGPFPYIITALIFSSAELDLSLK